MNKKFEVWVESYKDKPLEHLYNIFENGKLLNIRVNENIVWNPEYRGKEVAFLKNSGDGVTIGIDGLKDSIKLNYTQVALLKYLLNAEEPDGRTEFKQYTTVKTF